MARRSVKPKTPKVVTVDMAGLTGEGANKTEAREDLNRQIRDALDGPYYPTLISAHYKSALIWREPCGWAYALLHPERAHPETHDERLWGNGNSYASFTEADRAARRHMAQWIFEFDGATGACVIQDEDDRRDHRKWVEWQYCYKAWRDSKRNDVDAHREACNRNWPEGVEPVDVDALPE